MQISSASPVLSPSLGEIRISLADADGWFDIYETHTGEFADEFDTVTDPNDPDLIGLEPIMLVENEQIRMLSSPP